jgi:hypothetical protein
LTGPRGPPGDSRGIRRVKEGGFVFARHSQQAVVPACPSGTSRLWEGYSLTYTWSLIARCGQSHTSDLGEHVISKIEINRSIEYLNYNKSETVIVITRRVNGVSPMNFTFLIWLSLVCILCVS